MDPQFINEINVLIKKLSELKNEKEKSKGGGKLRKGGAPTDAKNTMQKTDTLLTAMQTLLLDTQKSTPGYARPTCLSATRRNSKTETEAGEAANLYIQLQNEKKQNLRLGKKAQFSENVNKFINNKKLKKTDTPQKKDTPQQTKPPTQIVDLCYDTLFPILQEANSLFSNLKIVCTDFNECVKPHSLTKLVKEMLNKGLSIQVKYDKDKSITSESDVVELTLSKDLYDFASKKFLSEDPKTEIVMNVHSMNQFGEEYKSPVIYAEFSELKKEKTEQNAVLEAFVINEHENTDLYNSTQTYSYDAIYKFLFTFIARYQYQFGFNIYIEPVFLDEYEVGIVEYATELSDVYTMLFNSAIELLNFKSYDANDANDKYDLPKLSGKTSDEKIWIKQKQEGGKHTKKSTVTTSITHKGVTRKIHTIGRCKRVMYKKEMMSISEFKKALGPVRPKQNK